MRYVNTALKLTTLSNIILFFLHEENNSCGNKSYGLPAASIHSYCACAEHFIPIDFIGLLINIVYHFVLWYAILYLWQDTKETWHMFKNRRQASN